MVRDQDKVLRTLVRGVDDVARIARRTRLTKNQVRAAIDRLRGRLHIRIVNVAPGRFALAH